MRTEDAVRESTAGLDGKWVITGLAMRLSLAAQTKTPLRNQCRPFASPPYFSAHNGYYKSGAGGGRYNIITVFHGDGLMKVVVSVEKSISSIAVMLLRRSCLLYILGYLLRNCQLDTALKYVYLI